MRSHDPVPTSTPLVFAFVAKRRRLPRYFSASMEWISDPKSAVATLVCKRAVDFPSKVTYWSGLASKRSLLGAVNCHPNSCVVSEVDAASAADATRKVDATKKRIVQVLPRVFIAFSPLAAGTKPPNAGYAVQSFIARRPRRPGLTRAGTDQPSAA